MSVSVYPSDFCLLCDTKPAIVHATALFFVTCPYGSLMRCLTGLGLCGLVFVILVILGSGLRVTWTCGGLNANASYVYYPLSCVYGIQSAVGIRPG